MIYCRVTYVVYSIPSVRQCSSAERGGDVMSMCACVDVCALMYVSRPLLYQVAAGPDTNISSPVILA